MMTFVFLFFLFLFPDRSDIGEYRCEVVFDQGTLEERRTSRRAVVKGAWIMICVRACMH